MEVIHYIGRSINQADIEAVNQVFRSDWLTLSLPPRRSSWKEEKMSEKKRIPTRMARLIEDPMI
jgi:ABC-type ATPase with predicted acetyltransferase domain